MAPAVFWGFGQVCLQCPPGSLCPTQGSADAPIWGKKGPLPLPSNDKYFTGSSGHHNTHFWGSRKILNPKISEPGEGWELPQPHKWLPQPTPVTRASPGWFFWVFVTSSKGPQMVPMSSTIPTGFVPSQIPLSPPAPASPGILGLPSWKKAILGGHRGWECSLPWHFRPYWQLWLFPGKAEIPKAGR